ncbi:hypothetical protein CRP01_30775 [Flavilitoribacter nigricans DSM 23189 = NBRC 102662]|uniref:Uncharacterized protein n=1 Tax=Flavilitoribacter nigricans (strain ATCC 23147 / DSM 23189 / NBRC 102662 / NCIMB 1420 / SS-2) TaxID=1122177 RepID=A0A2D0N2Y2_FLAN2|nr:hypothetical protein CRP01_30775 [Flavilitoribacter nigricans DSM 23189 = NBRC 102662]
MGLKYCLRWLVGATILSTGDHPFVIKYFYQHSQNQLSIGYKMESDTEFSPFEDLIKILPVGE